MRLIFSKYIGRKAIKIIFIIITLLLILNIISTKSEKAFQIIGYRAYTVTSGSMEPTLEPGDLILVKAIKSKDNLINKVVTFKSENQTITHRIVDEVDDGYITKGDNNNTEDSKVLQEESIVGKMVIKIPSNLNIYNMLYKDSIKSVILIFLGILLII